MKREVPKKYKHTDVEANWKEFWDSEGVYEWDPSIDREHTFIVDTPPPTVSGSLHVGHVFSYTHTDLIVRFQRMLGKNIMYPMGWDDNGLPTERRVQNTFGITCNPRLPYQEDWKPEQKSAKQKKKPEEISRQNFIDACDILTKEDEKAFEDLWRSLGLSVEWKQQYATIDAHCRRVSQYSFLDLVEKQLVYSEESPTMWDVGFQTALAQADVEDREKPGAYHDIRFAVEGGGSFTIATTRPELLVACIAVVAHPSDERYQGLFGKSAITPLFGAKVPITPSEHADPEKGSGIMMVCTFGDAADVEWWKTSSLPIKQVIGRNGRFESVDFTKEPFLSIDAPRAAESYSEIDGNSVIGARKKVVELLAEENSGFDESAPALIAEPRAIEHPVKFYEKGDQPLEFVTTRQWFIKILEHKDALLEQGDKIDWHPSHMKTRYSNWVRGLNYDWCISRQRFFGVPFPVWYRLDEKGLAQYDSPIFADAAQLPVDPLAECPEGFTEEQRGEPGGFIGDPDVMDTWATSSLTPQIVSHWGADEARHAKLFPMDMRPQSHEIIRTWAFYTIAKAWMHEGEIPWRNVVISGWILDPDRKKMSKSKGNVVTPGHLLEQYSSDAVRYWASRARLGVDTAYDENVFTNGRKLVMKLFNASRFVHGQLEAFGAENISLDAVTHELDRALIESMRSVVEKATESFLAFDYAQALSQAEAAFWSFCDSYLELAKIRAYSEENPSGRASAVAALEWSLSVFLRLFAPVLPYITEEVWSWHFADSGEAKDGRLASIHRAAWPSVEEVTSVPAPTHASSFECAVETLAAIHHAKSKAQKTLKWPVEALAVRGDAGSLAALQAVLDDIGSAGRVSPDAFSFTESSAENSTGRFEIEVELANEMLE